MKAAATKEECLLQPFFVYLKKGSSVANDRVPFRTAEKNAGMVLL
jgi:hypothetical protein